ncbi:MAG: YraN family protein [Muribaculaceae bacterium]
MAEHNETGRWGERVACDFLVEKGYAIKETNWRMPPYEIDIVAIKGNRIVFVEVKTRSDDFLDPIAAVDKRKMANMTRAANAFVNHYDIPHEVQFDIITITGDKDNYKIEHFPDAFYPPLRSYR